MLDFDTAQATLAGRAHAPDTTETLPLDALHGRVLAEDVAAEVDLPRADNSAMDGYALRCADAAPGAMLLEQPVDAVGAFRLKDGGKPVAEGGHDGAAQFPVAEMRGDDDHAFAVGAGLGQVIEIFHVHQPADIFRAHSSEPEKINQVLAEVFEIHARHARQLFRRNGLALVPHDLTQVAPDCPASFAIAQAKTIRNAHAQPIGERMRQFLADDLRQTVGNV